MKLRNILAGAGVLAALAFANGASAATYNLGTLTATTGLSYTVIGAKGAVDDIFNFNINPPPLTTYGQLIDYYVTSPTGKLLSDVFSSGTISLYNATTHTLLDQVGIMTAPMAGSTTFTNALNLQPDHYYFEVAGTVKSAVGANYTVGVAGAPVPEPAAWAMMIAGLGLIGSMLRVRARREDALTVA